MKKRLTALLMIFTMILSISIASQAAPANGLTPEDFASDVPPEGYGLTETGAFYPLAATSYKNEPIIFDYLVNVIGYNEAVACGILANIWAESRFSEASTGDQGTSHGICQWHKERWYQEGNPYCLVNWCRANGYDENSLQGQLAYLKVEINPDNNLYAYNSKSIWNMLMACPNTAEGAYEAGRIWCYYYERPSNKDEKSKQRGANARDTYWPVYKPAFHHVYPDVNSSHWYYDSVIYMKEQSIMTGFEDGYFHPSRNLTRGQFVTTLYRIKGSPAVNGANPFPDVKADEFYEKAVIWAAERNVVNGYEDGHFYPAKSITREQLVTMLYRYALAEGKAQATEYNISSFRDAKKVSAFALPAMKWAVQKGIITGKSYGTLIDPLGTACRAECAEILTRYLNIFE